MSEPEAIATVIPETFAQLRESFERWQALTPEGRAELEAAWAREDEADRLRRLAQWRSWRAEEVPPRFAHATVFHPAAQAWVEAICEDPNYRGLLIAGPTGVGKTHLLWGLYHELAERGGPRMEVVKLVRLLSSLRPGGDSTQDTIDKLCRVPVLAIDDLGVQKSSPWVDERLYEIIDSRYDAMLPIVATTNRKNLDGTIAEQTVSRLADLCTWLVLTGADRRRIT